MEFLFFQNHNLIKSYSFSFSLKKTRNALNSDEVIFAFCDWSALNTVHPTELLLGIGLRPFDK